MQIPSLLESEGIARNGKRVTCSIFALDLSPVEGMTTPRGHGVSRARRPGRNGAGTRGRHTLHWIGAAVGLAQVSHYSYLLLVAHDNGEHWDILRHR